MNEKCDSVFSFIREFYPRTSWSTRSKKKEKQYNKKWTIKEKLLNKKKIMKSKRKNSEK